MNVGFAVVEALAAALVGAGSFAVTFAYAGGGPAPGRAIYDRYVAGLERQLRLCFIDADAGRIARGQVVVALGALLLGAALAAPALLLVCPLALAGPPAFLARRRKERSLAFTAQADSFILALANSLRAVPNIGAALEGLLPVLRSPVKEEISLALSEMRVGSTVEQAIRDVSERAQSSAFDGAVSALLIGRQVGGDLPRILETTAATLREMNRLNGVVRTKTSEARGQLTVLALFPLAVVVAFDVVSPGYFDPLEHTVAGRIVTGAAAVLWLAALLLARELSRVDL